MTDQFPWIVQLSLGVTFALSAASKLREPRLFVHGVEEFRILPHRTVFVFALAVIFCEVLLSLSHLSGFLLTYTAPVGVAMLCSFLIAVSINLAKKRNVPCFCFGGSEDETVSPRSVARLLVVISGEVVVLLGPGHSSSRIRDGSHTTSNDFVLALAWTLFTLIATVWMLSLPDLLRLILPKFSGQTRDPSDSVD